MIRNWTWQVITVGLLLACFGGCSPVRAQEPVLSRENVCHLYGQAGQGASAWNKDDSCTIPRVDLLDLNYHQGDFVCCGSGAGSPTTNRDVPPGLELVVTGGHYWSVASPKLQGDQFFLHSYCGPEPPPGPGCNVDVQVWAHYRIIPAAAKPADTAAAQNPPRPDQPPDNKTAPPSSPAAPSSPNWDKVLAFAFGAFFAIVMLLIALFDRDPTPLGILIYRVVLALVAAGIGAVIPGMIEVNVQPFIRAGGAIALFVIVFWFNPPSLLPKPPQRPQPG